LSEALGQLLEEGLQQVIGRHGVAARACREGIKGMGLRLWPSSESIAAASTTVVKVPEELKGGNLRRHMFEKYGVMVLPGFKGMEDELLGVAHMARAANPMHVVVALAAMEKSLVDLGYPGTLGKGVGAALSVI
jgi:pyridoxamine--pyruvate transaminase